MLYFVSFIISKILVIKKESIKYRSTKTGTKEALLNTAQYVTEKVMTRLPFKPHWIPAVR